MTKPYLSAAEIAATPERRHVHQFNDNGVRMTRTLSELTGLTRLGVHLVRLEPGRDSTTHHYHDTAGRGRARIGSDEFEVGPGDFMGFPAGSDAHSMHNPFDTDLVYLVGGEHPDFDLVHYPDIGRSMVNSRGVRHYADWPDIHKV